MSKDILIFAKRDCADCEQLHQRLAEEGVEHRYEFVDEAYHVKFFIFHGLEGDEARFPQIMVDGLRIGGAKMVAALL